VGVLQFALDIDREAWMTFATVFAVAAISAAMAVRYAQSRIVREVRSDIDAQVRAARTKLREEKRRTLLASKIGRYRNNPPQVYHDGYF
jgi:hypothetical protein